MSNNQTLGYDGIKKMLNTLRNLNETVAASKSLNEQVQPQQEEAPVDNQQRTTDYTVVNDVEVKFHSSDKADQTLAENEKASLSQLIDNFRTQVSEIADFEEGFNIYPESIRLDGKISDMGMSFVLIAGNERGVYVNADMLELTAEAVLILDKLEKFQHGFEDVVNEMIVNRKTN